MSIKKPYPPLTETTPKPKKEPTWTKTKVQGLYRHRDGGYYARLYGNGKEEWHPLETKYFSIAKSRLTERRLEHTRRKSLQEAERTGKLTFGEAARLYLQKRECDPHIKESTRHYWNQIISALFKSWPEVAPTDVRRITSSACHNWAVRFARSGISATRFNNYVAVLRQIFELAIKTGSRYDNPASDLKRLPVRGKLLALPTLDQFEQFVDTIRSAGAWCSRDCATFVQFLAYTGCRKEEAAHVTWNDVDFKKGELVVRGAPRSGTKDGGTKNGEIRRVPLTPAATDLLTTLREARNHKSLETPVLKVREAQKAMDTAAAKVGMERITHHDLRHFFATICIESGVDIPTVSRWLGHKEGGALAMKTYGHLRNEHSLAAAQLVSFSKSARKITGIRSFASFQQPKEPAAPLSTTCASAA